MRVIIVVCCMAAALWGGYWFVGSSTLSSQISGWFDQRRGEGWQADYSDISVAGFPNRFDTTISDLVLADPGTGVAWEAPFLQLMTLSYKPNEIIAVWPLTQVIATPQARYDILAAKMQGSLRVGADTRIPLEEAIFVIDGPRVRTNQWLTEAENLRFAVREIEDAENTYEIGLETEALNLPVRVRRTLDPAGLQPDAFEKLRLDARIAFDKPWDRLAIEQGRPQPQMLELREARATWGELDLRAAGKLSIDQVGQATGEVTIKAKNWREILAVIERSGLLPQSFLPLIERALEAATSLSGPSDSLDIPLTFSDGQISIGILPLGQAPVFRLR